MYRVWFTFRNILGEDVRDYLDNNGEGFNPMDALDVARELREQGQREVLITRMGTKGDDAELKRAG